ncbi:hypothetical protein BSL78_12650 [Apostichopus japonicus]|uniref:Protein kinase domain-containing protein n=1 Tax=Stichopus japonicus TaxID=307972 RepID=A0A2G8KQX8_STIJA|nr:hypothetical protein BSL78_12650 [Apostichopus japonicus]
MPFGSLFRRTSVSSRPRLERRSVWKKVFCTLPCCGRTYADDDGIAGEYIPAHIHPIPRRLPYYGPTQEDSHVTVSSEMKTPASRVLSFPGEDEGTRAGLPLRLSSLIDTIFSGEPSSLTTTERDESKRHQTKNTPGDKHHRNPSDHHEILPEVNNSERPQQFKASISELITTSISLPLSRLSRDIQVSSANKHRLVSDITNIPQIGDSFQHQVMLSAPRSHTPSRQLSGDMPTLRLCRGVSFRSSTATANSAWRFSALEEAAGPSPLMLSVANAIKFGTHNTVTLRSNVTSINNGASSCINHHVIPLMCTPVQMSVKHQLFGTHQTAQCSSSSSIFGQLSILHPVSKVVKSPEHHDILMQSISANRRVYDHLPDNGCKLPANWISNNPIPVDHAIPSQNAIPQCSIATSRNCSPKYTLQPFKPTNTTVVPIGKKITVKTPGIFGNNETQNKPFHAQPVMPAWNLAINWMGSNLFHQGASNVAMVGQPLGQNVNSPLIPTAAGVNPIGGFRFKTPKLTSPAWGTLGGSPTTPPQNNAPNLSTSSKALKNVPHYPWKNPFLQNVQTAIPAKKSLSGHAQNINGAVQQQPLYNPFQNYTAGIWNTQQLALHSPPPKSLKASDYNLPSSCDVIAKSDLEDVCYSMQMPTILGSGSFGEVRLMRQLSSRRFCAVKVHHKNRDKRSIIKDLQKETSMLTSLSHLDCIPKLFGISRIGSDTDVPVLVQEFLGDSVTFKSTTVADVIDAKGLNGPSSFSVAIQVCRAIKDIHFAGIIHCDLKTDNIMFLRGPSGRDGDINIKIIDFGKAVSRTGRAKYEHFPRNEHANIRKQCFHIAQRLYMEPGHKSVYRRIRFGKVLSNVDASPGRFLRKLGLKCLAKDMERKTKCP